MSEDPKDESKTPERQGEDLGRGPVGSSTKSAGPSWGNIIALLSIFVTIFGVWNVNLHSELKDSRQRIRSLEQRLSDAKFEVWNGRLERWWASNFDIQCIVDGGTPSPNEKTCDYGGKPPARKYNPPLLFDELGPDR